MEDIRRNALAGKSVLICGPPMGKHQKVEKLLYPDSEGSLVITDESRDSVGDETIVETNADSGLEPSDLTGLGIEITEWSEGIDSPNILFSRISSFDVLVEKKRLFRFLHILVSRIVSEEGVFIGRYDETGNGNLEVYKPLFDVLITTEDNDNCLFKISTDKKTETVSYEELVESNAAPVQ